jgi:hypothetical protein
MILTRLDTSSCAEEITCYDPNDFLPTPSSDSTDNDDDSGLSVGGVIGIIMACVVVGAVAVTIAIFRMRNVTPEGSSGIKEPLT